jgi:GNAT superfamily N-acetyltransferase
MRWYVRKVRDAYAREGAAKSTRWLLRATLSRVYRREDHLIIVRELASESLAVPEPIIDVRSLEECPPSAVLTFGERHAFPTPKALRYAIGQYRAFVALRDAAVVGYFWWISNEAAAQHPDLALNGIALDDDEAYGFWFFVAPDARAGGTATDLLFAAIRRLADLGYARTWGFVLADNKPARWLFALASYQPVRTVRIRTLCSTVSFCDDGVFVRRLGGRSRPPFGARRLLSFPH